MYKRTVKGAVMAKTNPRGEHNAMERCGNLTIKDIDHERITREEDAMRKYRADNRNTSKNVNARQYRGPDETTPVMSDAITANPDVRNKFNIMTYRGGKTGQHITMALTDLLTKS